MLETIRMIGVIMFVVSAPIALAIGMYNTYHPEFQRKMQELFNQHEKISVFIMLVYVIWSEIGILWTIVRIV